MNDFLKYLNSDDVDYELFVKKAIITIGIIIICYLFIKLFSWILRKISNNEKINGKIIRFARLFLIIASVLAIINMWISENGLFGVVVAIILAFIALAAKDIIMDLVAYIYIGVRQPFNVGNVIEIGESSGEVIDIDFLQFNLAEVGDLTASRTHTGRYISIPNRFIFQHPVYNFNHDNPFVIVDISVLAGFDIDREEVIKIAGKVAYEKYQDFLEVYDDEEIKKFDIKMAGVDADKKPKVRLELDPNGFRVYIQFFTAYYDIGKNKMIMQNALYDALKEANIEMPTPTFIRKVGE